MTSNSLSSSIASNNSLKSSWISVEEFTPSTELQNEVTASELKEGIHTFTLAPKAPLGEQNPTATLVRFVIPIDSLQSKQHNVLRLPAPTQHEGKYSIRLTQVMALVLACASLFFLTFTLLYGRSCFPLEGFIGPVGATLFPIGGGVLAFFSCGLIITSCCIKPSVRQTWLHV